MVVYDFLLDDAAGATIVELGGEEDEEEDEQEARDGAEEDADYGAGGGAGVEACVGGGDGEDGGAVCDLAGGERDILMLGMGDKGCHQAALVDGVGFADDEGEDGGEGCEGIGVGAFDDVRDGVGEMAEGVEGRG